MVNFSWRRAARVVACLDAILALFWGIILVGCANLLDEMACVAIKGNITGTDACGGSRDESLLTFVSKFWYGSEKNPDSVMMWKLVGVIILAAAPQQFFTSINLIRAAKSGSTPAEVLSKMSKNWRPFHYCFFMDTGLLCSYFIGNYKLFGACHVVRLTFDTIKLCYKRELQNENEAEVESGVEAG